MTQKTGVKNLTAVLICGAMLMMSVQGFQAADVSGETGEAGGTDRIEEILEHMTLEEKVGQMIMPSFRTWKENPEQEDSEAVPVTELNDELREAIRETRPGGIILFGENCRESEQTRKLIQEMQEANRSGNEEHSVPLLISIDQEGGIVARLGQGTRGIGNMALSATGDPENARMEGRMMGEDLRALGVNTDFAPVCDVNCNPANPVIGVRSFSDDPQMVAEYAGAFQEGLHDASMISSLKHFPGHGDTDTDSHTGFPLVDKSLEELEAVELLPFRELIRAGADMIMTAHIQYPQLEKETSISTSTGEEVYIPATMSHYILTDLLRGELGFEGVIVTDALEMDAIRAHFAMEDVLKKTIEAGVDILLIPVNVTDSNAVQELKDILSRMASLVEDGEIPESRIDESVGRILALKTRYGLFDSTQETPETQTPIDPDTEEEWTLAQKAVTLLKNDEKLLPYQMQDNEKIALFYSAGSRLNTAEFCRTRLITEGLVPESASFEAYVYNPDTREECLAAAQEADLVIAVPTTFGGGGFNPLTEEGSEGAVLDEIIEAAHEQGTKVVLISAYLPYDVARFQSADAILISFGSTPMNELPQEGFSYMVNLPAAICAVFGEYEPGGRLPIDIPALNENYEFSDEILYTRGSGM